MTFNQIVWKMAKYNYRKYIFYLVCNILAVMFFFIFTTLIYNKQIEAEKLGHTLSIPAAALLLFTVFFIGYAHQIFMKKRRSEFGLFMTLGMTKRDITKLVLLENSMIAVIALIIGILAGTIFSRFFFWLLVKSLGIEEIVFEITIKMVVYSIIAFLLVFMLAVGQSLYVTMTKNIIQHLKNEKISENVSNKYPIIGGIGVLFVAGSVIGLYLTYDDYQGEYLLFWAFSTFIGLYIALHQFTSFIIEIIKLDKSFYYRRLLFLTNIDYKYKQLTSMMTLVTIMIMVTIFYTTVTLLSYIFTTNEVIENNPYDVGFIQTEGKNNLPVDDVYSIFEQQGNSVEEHTSVPIYTFFLRDYYRHIYANTFISLETFNAFTSRQLTLEDHEFIYYINTNLEITDTTAYENGLRLPGNEDMVYDQKETIAEMNFNLFINVGEVFIVNDSQMEVIKDTTDGFDAAIQLMNLENWQESRAAVNELEQAFHTYNMGSPPIDVENMIPEEEFFHLTSLIDRYESNNKANGIQFFVTIFLSILFLIGAFFLLYIQLFSETDKDIQRIRKLRRIGITSKEVKKMISQEMTTIFMIPTVLGITIALLYLIAVATEVGGVIENPEVLMHFFIISGIYFIIQFAFLLYAKRKMFLQMTNDK